MKLLEIIDKEIEATEGIVKLFEAPPDPSGSERQLGWIEGTLDTWKRTIIVLQKIRKFITEEDEQ